MYLKISVNYYSCDDLPVEELTLCLLLCVVILLRVLRQLSNFLRRRMGPNIWGAQNPHPLFSRIVAEIGGRRPPFPPENMFSGFFQICKKTYVFYVRMYQGNLQICLTIP